HENAAAAGVKKQTRNKLAVDQEETHSRDKGSGRHNRGGGMCLGGQRSGFQTQGLSLPNNTAEIGEGFSDAAASLALQEQTNGKEPEIRHTDPVGGVLQRFFQLDADAQLVHYLLKLGADRRPNLMSYEFDCLGCG